MFSALLDLWPVCPEAYDYLFGQLEGLAKAAVLLALSLALASISRPISVAEIASSWIGEGFLKSASKNAH